MTKVKNKNRKKEISWILYDVANSAFVLLVSTIIPIYFEYLSTKDGGDGVSAMIWWGYASSIVTIILVILNPILGTISDSGKYKLPIFLTFVLMGSISCLALAIPMSWLLFLAIFIVAKIGCEGSQAFYDSMLIDIVEKDRYDKVSSEGYAYGYIGSCIPFLISLVFVLFYEKIGITFNVAMAIAFIITALWWVKFTIPLIKSYVQKTGDIKKDGVCLDEDTKKEKKIGFKNTLKRLLNTFKDLVKNKAILLFILAFFFYIDGVHTIISMATSYGRALGFDSTKLLIALLVTQIVAFPCALLFGFLSNKIKLSYLLASCVIAYTGIGVFAIFLKNEWQFFTLAILVGMFQGGIQALSRAYFAKITPIDKATAYFSIYDICGKGAAFLGTLLVSLVTQLTNDANLGIIPIVVMFLIGLVLYILADKSYNKHGKVVSLEKTNL